MVGVSMLAQAQHDKQLFTDKTSDKTESRAISAIRGHDWDTGSYHPKTQAALSEGFSQCCRQYLNLKSKVVKLGCQMQSQRNTQKKHGCWIRWWHDCQSCAAAASASSASCACLEKWMNGPPTPTQNPMKLSSANLIRIRSYIADPLCAGTCICIQMYCHRCCG